MAKEKDIISQDDIDALLQQAELGGDEAMSGADLDALLGGTGMGSAATGAASAAPTPFRMEAFQETGGEVDETKIELLMDVDLDVKVVLGRNAMRVEDILRLKPGSVVELDNLAGDPLDILVNDKLVARGEVLVLNDNFCVRISEILDPEQRVKVE